MTADLFGRRSMLFLPASNPRAIVKARASDADLVVLDLEDAVKPSDKAEARSAAVDALREAWPMPVAIRLNGTGTQWHSDDLDAVRDSGAAFVVVPRVERPIELEEVQVVTRLPVAAMVETARGVLAVTEIARNAAAVIAGTNDLAASLRLQPDAGRASMQMALQSIVLAARAVGKPCFDGVFNRLDDLEGFAAEASESRRLGFDGKSLIHPDQIAPCHAAFAPSQAELDRARRLVEAATGGAERFEGEMIERMHVDAARRLLQRGS